MGKKSREKKQAGVVGRRRQMIQLDGINRRSAFETEAGTAPQQSLRATRVSGIGLLGAYQEDSDDDLGTQSPLSGVVMQQSERPAERIPDNKMQDELAGFLAEINAIGETSTATENEERSTFVAEVYDPQNFDPHTQGHLLPEPWQAVYDESSGYHYFWHCENNEVQWVPPPAPVVQEAAFPITPPPPAVPASTIAVKPVGVENEIMVSSGIIEAQKSSSLEDTEEELRKKEMSSKLAGLSKKERIKLLLQKNNISTEPASTEPSSLAADNTQPLEPKDGDMKAQKNTQVKQENIKVLPEKVRDIREETKCVMSAVSSLVAGYDSDLSDSQDDNDMEDFNVLKPINVIHQDTDTVMEPDTGMETGTGMQPDAGIETGMGMEHDTEPDTGMDTGTGMKHDRESGTVMEPDTEPDMGTKTGIGMSMEHYTKPGRGMEPYKEPHTAVESDVSKQGLLVETLLEKGDSNRKIDVFESIQEMGSIKDIIEVDSNMDNASKKEDTLKEDQSVSSNETIQLFSEAGDLEKMPKTEEYLIENSTEENRKKISVDFVKDDEPVVVRSFATSQAVVENNSKADMKEGMDLVGESQSSKVDTFKQSGEKDKVDNSTIKGDEKNGKEFSVDIFADESENEEEKNSEKEKNSEQEDFKEEGSSENGESEKEIFKDKNIEENETEKDNSIEKVITVVEKTDEKKKRGSEKDKEAVQKIKKISKSEEKSKVKNKEKDKEHRSKDKRKRDHKDKRDKHSERKPKEDRRERSSKKKHKDKSERSGERSSDRSDRSSRRSQSGKSKAQIDKQEAPQLSKEEQLKQDEEKRKEIEAEVEREERRRVEYENLKKEEVLKEKERQEEEKKNIEEMEKQDAKKKEETENEMNDFAEMLLEGALETDVEVAAAETNHNEAAEDMDISDNDTESFDENYRPPLPPMPPPDERIPYPKEEFPDNRNDPECSKYDDETTRIRISDLSRLIFDKLAFLEVARKGLTTFQVMLIEIETRMADWREGALDSDYLLYRLEEVDAQICKYEETAAPSGWTCQWSSEHGMYYYYSEKKGQSTWSYPTADTSVIQAGPVFGPSQKSSGTSTGTSKIVQPSVTGLENYGYGRTDMMMWRSDIVENRTTETVKKLSALVNNESEQAVSSSHDPYRDPYRQTVVSKEVSRDISPDKICDSVLSPALPPSDAAVFVPVPPPPGEEDEESLPNPWEDTVRSGTSSPLPPGMVATALPTKMLPVKTQMSAVIATAADVNKPGADASSATIVQAAARLTSFAEASNEPSLIGAPVLLAQATTSTEAVAGSAAKTEKKKKVKRKKLTTSGLPSKKLKKVSSLVQKWQQVKQKVVEEMAEESSEDEAPEVIAQKRIEEWRRSQLQSGKAACNPNFEEIKGDWRQRLKKK